MDKETVVMTRREAAAVLRISVGMVDLLRARGQLNVLRIGRRVVIPLTEVERLLASGVRPANAGAEEDEDW